MTTFRAHLDDPGHSPYLLGSHHIHKVPFAIRGGTSAGSGDWDVDLFGVCYSIEHTYTLHSNPWSAALSIVGLAQPPDGQHWVSPEVRAGQLVKGMGRREAEVSRGPVVRQVREDSGGAGQKQAWRRTELPLTTSATELAA